MTRFARAKGSKSSNERKPEEATSWSEMKNAMLAKEESKPEEKVVSEEEEVKIDDTPKKTEWASLGDDTPRSKAAIIKQYFGRRIDPSEETKKAKKKKKSKDTETEAHSKKKSKDTETEAHSKKKSKSEKEAKKPKNKPDEVEVLSDEVEIISDEVKIIPEEVEPEVKMKKKKKKRELKETEDDLEVVFMKKKKKLSKTDEEGSASDESKSHDDEETKSKKSDRNKDNKKFMDDKDKKLKHKKHDKKRNFNPKQKEEKKLKKKPKTKEPNPHVEELNVNGKKIPITKFQGFYVTLEDAERLKKLRKDMIKQGISKAKLESALKLERRRAEKALSRLKKSVCFHCRGHGHLLSNCPELHEKENTGTGICYKCGSTEHSAAECKVVRDTTYQFAECFICKEQGHIARQCPDNPRGLYPQGGACRECGDVTHLRKDCPKIQAQKAEEVVTVRVRRDRDLECLDEEIADREKQNEKKKVKKNSPVKF